MKSTFIKLDRSILGWRWYRDANTFRLFMHLLLTANIKKSGLGEINIGRGEVVTSYESVANILKLTKQQVRTAFRHLKATGEITVTRYSKFSVISIVNYELYQAKQHSSQQSRQQSGNNQATDEQHHLKNIRSEELKELYDDDYDAVPLEKIVDTSDVLILSQTFGNLPKIMQEKFTETVELLMSQFWDKTASDFDILSVFSVVFNFYRSQDKRLTIDDDCIGLLTKAFEASANAGSCNVNYIGGVYRNYKKRGIATMTDYEDVDYARWKEGQGG